MYVLFRCCTRAVFCKSVLNYNSLDHRNVSNPKPNYPSKYNISTASPKDDADILGDIIEVRKGCMSVYIVD